MSTILVVDDSATDRQLSGHLLQKKSGWSIIYAENGIQALSQLELHIPDLVLTDLMMPEMNGLELVAAVKNKYPLIPVVLMTAQGSEEIAVQALEEGAASYVPKSSLALLLVDTVDHVLSASAVERNYSRLMHRMIKNESIFTLENDLSLFPSVISFLKQMMSNTHFCTDIEQLRVGVALEEALLNAYYHGNLEVVANLRETDHIGYYKLATERLEESPYCDRRIHISANLSANEMRFAIADEGPGFNPADLPDPTDPANLEKPCGRGLLLMRTFMDEVSYSSIGNEVILVKRRSIVDAPEDDDKPPA